MRKIMIFFMLLLLIASLSFAAAKKVRVIAEKALLYSNSKTSSELLDSFAKGTVLNVLGSGGRNGWFYVSGKSLRWGSIITGFVQASQVELIEETPKPTPEVNKETPKIEELAKVQDVTKPADKKPAKIEEAMKVQEVKKPEEKKPAKTEEPVKTEEIAKPAEFTAAQKTTAPIPTGKKQRRKTFSIQLGYNAGFASQNGSISWSKEVYYENAAFGVNYAAKKGNSLNAGLGYKFSNSVAVEVGVDIASRNLNANYEASIPHPLYFNHLRDAENMASYKISESAAFLRIVFSVPFSRFGLDLFAGPAYVFSSAELIGGIQYSQSYPYSSVTISAQNQKISKNVFGFNAGASLIFNFSQSMGIFLSGQYYSASADFKPSEVPGLKLSLGGFKAGGGIKILF